MIHWAFWKLNSWAFVIQENCVLPAGCVLALGYLFRGSLFGEGNLSRINGAQRRNRTVYPGAKNWGFYSDYLLRDLKGVAE